MHQQVYQVNVMVHLETVRLQLTVNARDREADLLFVIGLHVDLQADRLVELVIRVVREFLPCLQALASLLRAIVIERVRERD